MAAGRNDEAHAYLKAGREALLWKLDGLGEYDLRRPLTPTGTNLLGLVKHLAGVEGGYFGETFGRPFAEAPVWADDTDPLADMWATAAETREDVVGFYRRACAHADATIEALAPEAIGVVSWWNPETSTTTLSRILVHVATETHRHAGHADIVRELIDGAAGLRKGNENLPAADEVDWVAHVARVEAAAQAAAHASGQDPPVTAR